MTYLKLHSLPPNGQFQALKTYLHFQEEGIHDAYTKIFTSRDLLQRPINLDSVISKWCEETFGYVPKIHFENYLEEPSLEFREEGELLLFKLKYSGMNHGFYSMYFNRIISTYNSEPTTSFVLTFL